MKAHTLAISLLVSLILTSTAVFVYDEAVSSSAPHPTPTRFAITRGHLTVWRDPHGALVGIVDPVVYTSPIAETPRSISRHTMITPRCPLRVIALSAHRFWIQPALAWPAHARIHLTVEPTGVRPQSTEFVTDAAKSITVNLTRQQVLAYEDGRLMRMMSTSTGVAPDWVTPTGTFWIYKKVPDDHMKGGIPGTTDSWNVRHVPWAQYIYGGIAIHGAWWNHHFGTPRSHGCIQLATRTNNPHPGIFPDDAKWLYHFTDMGTPVIVTGKTPPTSRQPLQYPHQGPLKPEPNVSKSSASSNR